MDGYDFNVLFSGMKSIIKYKPKLFFEYMSLNDKDYVSLIEKLFSSLQFLQFLQFKDFIFLFINTKFQTSNTIT